MKSREIIADNLSEKSGGVGVASQRLIPTSEPIWIADTHRHNEKRFVVHGEEGLTAFVELEKSPVTLEAED